VELPIGTTGKFLHRVIHLTGTFGWCREEWPSALCLLCHTRPCCCQGIMPWLRTELHNAPIAGPSLILSIDESSSLFKTNEDNGILLASLSYICKKRYNKTKCFHVSLEKSLQLSNLIFNINLYDRKKSPCKSIIKTLISLQSFTFN
jgi:hypothetical protein